MSSNPPTAGTLTAIPLPNPATDPLPPLVEGPMAPAPPEVLPPLPEIPAADVGPQAPLVQKITFRTKDVDPPTEYWVTPDDFMLVGVVNGLAGVTLQVQCRIWTPEGDLSVPALQITPPADRVLRFTSLPLYYGFLYSVVCFASGTPLPARGQTYVSLQIVRTPNQVLTAVLPMAANYVQANGPVQWPYSQNAGATAGTGVALSITGTIPGPGAEWLQTVPTNARWQIRSVFFQLTTSAGAGSRFPGLEITDGVNDIAIITHQAAQGPSSTILYTFAQGYPLQVAEGTLATIAFLTNYTLESGWKWASRTIGIQGGDQFTAPQFVVEEVSNV